MFLSRKIFIVCLLGAVSGFTLMISGNTLNYWLTKDQIDIRIVGMFAFILLPYSINFIWAPLFDSVKVKYLTNILGNRLAWISVIQWILAVAILIISMLNPASDIFQFSIYALFISFMGSTQDSLLGALKTELIAKEKQGEIAGIYIFGYRIGMLISGSFAIYLSSFLSFNTIYQYLAVGVLVMNLALILLVKGFRGNVSPHSKLLPRHPELVSESDKTLKRPRIKFGMTYKTSFIILVIIFLILYRLPDNFINIMINPFLIKIGFNAKEIASTGKFCGIIGAIIGGFVASHIMKKKSIIDSLLMFGIIHALSHGFFIIQEYYGKNLPLLFTAIAFESITGGMSMAAYLAFIASLCQGKFRATQYSFFSSMMGLSRAILPAFSGYIVSLYGWNIFFYFTIIATIPSLILLPLLKKYIVTKI